MSQGYGSGWLTFESLYEKRRLLPIPPHWDEMSQADLRLLCERAKAVTRIDTSSPVA
jgi:hypothetical protein